MDKGKMDLILDYAQKGAQLRQAFFQKHAQQLVDIATLMAQSISQGHKILFCGNGGSAADAQHLAAEFVNRFEVERNPLPAMALTTDSSIITAIGNDYSFDLVFAKQVQALGQKGDILVAISTSGNSKNIITALRQAKDQKMLTVGLTGAGGGAMLGLCTHLLAIPSKRTALIQEMHITCGHLLCLLADQLLLSDS